MATIRVRFTIANQQRELLDDPDNPANPHFCEVDRQATASVVTRGIKRDFRQAVLDQGAYIRSPVNSHQKLLRDSVSSQDPR